MRLMRLVMALAAMLTTAPGICAEQAVTAGQLMANGFEIRGIYTVERGTPVLVLQKGGEAFFCSPLQNDALFHFQLAPVGKDVKALPPLPTICTQIK
jgi:hypothetical protein